MPSLWLIDYYMTPEHEPLSMVTSSVWADTPEEAVASLRRVASVNSIVRIRPSGIGDLSRPQSQRLSWLTYHYDTSVTIETSEEKETPMSKSEEIRQRISELTSQIESLHEEIASLERSTSEARRYVGAWVNLAYHIVTKVYWDVPSGSDVESRLHESMRVLRTLVSDLRSGELVAEMPEDFEYDSSDANFDLFDLNIDYYRDLRDDSDLLRGF